MKSLYLKAYLEALMKSKPNWNVTVNVHGREVIYCNVSELDLKIIASNLLYAPVGLVAYDYPSQRYIYYVD